ncbi:non-heme iron oxygenase ferredoxin subunit [Hyphococcus sp. DH-69]|uniref:non-heme iron oxygenase ferredoxin subunit n=1 Tax=Hyphococcus formosus TaxID=3143534 RepID=UPI00398AFA31
MEHILCRAEDVSDDEPLRVTLADGHAVTVYRWEDNFYCTDDLCTHGDASLAEGYVEDGAIICPFHLGSFCIKSGAPRAAPCSEPIAVYEVNERDGNLLIQR